MTGSKSPFAAEARALLGNQRHAVLSTHSADVEGFPFGSLVVFALDDSGRPLMHLSQLAQHTRNLERDSRASLIVFDSKAPDPVAAPRLTLLGRVERLPEDDVAGARARFLELFPSSEQTFELRDFAFYRLQTERCRYVGGFARAAWIDPADLR